MLGPAWVELIKRIPAALHDNLMAVTSTGAEIMIQSIMRLEDEFVILRGRPAGSTEQGRVLLLPWDQLNHVAFHKSIAETEVQRIFGNGEAVAAEVVEHASEKAAAKPEPATTSEAAPPEPATNASVPVPAPAAKPAPLSKSILLARLRARMANDIAKS